MGNTNYYTATLPFGAVVKLFTFDPDQMLELTPENRSQRALNAKRIPEIANYVLDHEDYIFSAITVSVDSDEVDFEPVKPGADIGELVLPLEAKYVINDGQHRVAGISEALRRDSGLAEDTISVVVLPDGGLERSQQIFSDLNRTVHKTSKSLDILFDHRLPINRITMACIEEVPLFKDRIDQERVSVSVRSANFATLSGLQQANVQMLGNLPERLPEAEVEDTRTLAIDFWIRLTDLVVPWRGIIEGDTKPQHARQVYVSSYALSLWALGFAGGAPPEPPTMTRVTSWTEILDGLSEIDWRKTNGDWQGICMAGTEVVTRAPTRRATARYIMWKLGLETERPAAVIADDRFRRAAERDVAESSVVTNGSRLELPVQKRGYVLSRSQSQSRSAKASPSPKFVDGVADVEDEAAVVAAVQRTPQSSSDHLEIEVRAVHRPSHDDGACLGRVEPLAEYAVVDERRDFTIAKSLNHAPTDGWFGGSAHRSRRDPLQVEQCCEGLSVLHRCCEDQGRPVGLHVW